jgi:tRNA 2-thiouridine synthesizing protein E
MPKKRKTSKAARRKPAPVKKRKTVSRTITKATLLKKRKRELRASHHLAQHAHAYSVPRSIYGILHPGAAIASDPNFRDAPDDWTSARARALAAEAGLTLTEDHWEVIRVLQGCYKDEAAPRIRSLRNALEARFASQGGMKYLFVVLPGGPIAQGCVLAGLKPPHGARDLSFGSVA